MATVLTVLIDRPDHDDIISLPDWWPDDERPSLPDRPDRPDIDKDWLDELLDFILFLEDLGDVIGSIGDAIQTSLMALSRRSKINLLSIYRS